MTNLSSDLREANPHLHIKGEYGCKKLIFAFGENRCRVTEMGMMGGSGGGRVVGRGTKGMSCGLISAWQGLAWLAE